MIPLFLILLPFPRSHKILDQRMNTYIKENLDGRIGKLSDDVRKMGDLIDRILTSLSPITHHERVLEQYDKVDKSGFGDHDHSKYPLWTHRTHWD